MTARENLELALKRLTVAIELLEAAQERRSQADATRTNLEEEFAVMQDDRTRLAVELDAAIARNKALASANDEVARRLERASNAIRGVLGSVSAAD
jgi:chromosome segregation ATPase